MKNKFILGLVLGIFLVGLVSAGVSVVQVKEGETASVGDTQISVSKITGNLLRRGSAEIQVNTPPPALPSTATFNQNCTNFTIPWLNQTNNLNLSLISSAGNFTINSSGVYVWSTQKGFKFAPDGKLGMNLQETKEDYRKWGCNRGWLDTAWICNIKTSATLF